MVWVSDGTIRLYYRDNKMCPYVVYVRKDRKYVRTRCFLTYMDAVKFAYECRINYDSLQVEPHMRWGMV